MDGQLLPVEARDPDVGQPDASAVAADNRGRHERRDTCDRQQGKPKGDELRPIGVGKRVDYHYKHYNRGSRQKDALFAAIPIVFL